MSFFLHESYSDPSFPLPYQIVGTVTSYKMLLFIFSLAAFSFTSVTLFVTIPTY